MFKVTSFVDTLDPNPEVHLFDNIYEAQDFVYDTIHLRVQWRVEHSQTIVEENEWEEMWEEETQLITLVEVD